MSPQLNRKTRRAVAVKAADAYGIKGKAAVVIREAYQAIVDGRQSDAVQLAIGVSKTNPNNVHPWLVLGSIALERRESMPAQVFFENALKIEPKNHIALGGKGKAHLIAADVIPAVKYFESAIVAGSKDSSMIRLYADIAPRLGRFPAAAEHLAMAAKRLSSAEAWRHCGDSYIGAEQNLLAADAFEKAFELDPNAFANKLAWAKSLIFRHKYEVANEMLDQLCENHLDDELPILKMIALRNLGRWDEAAVLIDYAYKAPVFYQRALAQAAYIQMDLGKPDKAEKFLQQSIHVDGAGKAESEKSLASYLFLKGEFKRGATYYSSRKSSKDSNRPSSDAVNDSSFSGQKQIFVRAEQGVGDQLALLPLVGQLGLLDADCITTFVGEERMRPLINCIAPSMEFCVEEDFSGEVESPSMLLGDFIGNLGQLPINGRKFGHYIHLPDENVDALKQRYAKHSNGCTVFGLAWRSQESNTGYHRSVPLERLIDVLPPNAFVVNLQYGNCQREIQRAMKLRPDITILDDPKIDQMKDLFGFLTQIAAVDCVITIDNTTAHACGAIGHPNAHLMLPVGAENMWYWGSSGESDPWYSVLRLHRQKTAQNWSHPLKELQQILN